jgi:predicted nucleic acid-binding protein
LKVYADTSALVKRYFREVGTDRVVDALRAARLVVTSRVAFAEAAAAIARRTGEGSLESRQRDRVLDRLARDFGRIAVVDVTETVTNACRELVVSHPLRGFDAIHLASALLVADDHRSEWTFLCSDKPLLDSAAAEGLIPLDPLGG